MLAVALLVAAACSSDDDAGSTTTTAGATTTTVEVPTFTGDADGPFCARLRDVDPATLLDGEPGEPADVAAGFQELVRTLRDLEAVAPAEVEPDVVLVAEGVAALDAALAAVGYDFDALATSSAAAEVTAAVNDPAFTTAGDRLSAYRAQVCGL